MKTRMTSAQTDVLLTINLRALTLMDIFSQGWWLYWKNFPQLLPIVIIIYLPMNLLRYLFINPWAMTSYADAGQLLEMAFMIFGFVAMVGVMEGAVYGQPLSWRAALHYAWLRWANAIGTMFRLLLPLLGWTLLWLPTSLFVIFFISNLLIWPCVFVMLIGYGKLFVDYGFWLHVVALRRRSGGDALVYSKALITGQWWSICGCQLAIMGAFGIPLLIFWQVCNNLFHSPLLLVSVTLLSQLVSLSGIAMGVLLFLRTEQRQCDAGALTDSDAQAPLSLEDETEIADNIADDIVDDIAADTGDPVTDAPLGEPFVSTRRPQWFALTFALGAGLLLLLLLVLINV